LLQTKVQVSEYEVLGEFLNDDIVLIDKYQRTFDPGKTYHIRENLMGKVVVEFEDVPGTELIGDKRPPEETSFGH
jgi:hypothetical protein